MSRTKRAAADAELAFWEKSNRDELYLGHAGWDGG